MSADGAHIPVGRPVSLNSNGMKPKIAAQLDPAMKKRNCKIHRGKSMKSEKALDQLTGQRDAGAGVKPQGKAIEDDFPGDFARLKLSVIRPAFENVGVLLEERGHEIHISEEPGGKIAIHIVPAGAVKSIHPHDWFPTFSLFAAPFTKTIGVHVRNARPNSEGSARGTYKPAQVDKVMVEKELMKFVGEIANWK